jgi:hypothetical protein
MVSPKRPYATQIVPPGRAVAKFGSAIKEHINSPDVKAIQGTYRGDPASLYLSQFESKYLQRFKSETIALPESAFMILDRLFADVDAYCADSSIRELGDLGDKELLAGANAHCSN